MKYLSILDISCTEGTYSQSIKLDRFDSFEFNTKKKKYDSNIRCSASYTVIFNFWNMI